MAIFTLSKKRYYMCPKCFNVYEFDYSVTIDTDNKDIGMIYTNNNNNISIYCAKCVNFFNEPIDMFEIDPLMVPVIKELNRKGWVTCFCCEGHIGPMYFGDTFQDALDKEQIDSSIPYISFHISQIADEILKRFSKEERSAIENAFSVEYYLFEKHVHNIINSNRKNVKYMINPPYHWNGRSYFNFRVLTDYDQEDDNEMTIRYNIDLPEEFRDAEMDKHGKYVHHEDYVKSVCAVKEQLDQKEVYMADLLQWAKDLPDLTKIKSFKEFSDLFHE